MRPVVVLFRPDGSREREEEIAAAREHFPVLRYRSEVLCGALVISRYYSLPYRNELVADLENASTILANTARGHSWIVDMDWAEDLKHLTPRTWDERAFPTCGHPGPFVVKGRVNSKAKLDWRRFAYAQDRRSALLVASELAHDSEIGRQGIVYREYVPLRTFDKDFTGLPITNEWRFFFWRTREVARGYYWSSASDDVKARAMIGEEGVRVARRAARIAAEHATFFVVDVAEREAGGWVVVEVNSGEQSGLSEIDPKKFYASLREAVDLETVIDLCPQCGIPEGDDHWARAGGDVPCEICGKLYYDHPMDEVHLGSDGAPWLHRVCDGRLVKT